MPRFLVLRLEGPMAAIGDVALGSSGPVLSLPTASMLTGLLGNALGWTSDASKPLQALQDRLVYASRSDRDSDRFVDFQTVKLDRQASVWTTRGVPEYRAGGPASYDGAHRRFRAYEADVCLHVLLSLAPADASLALDDLAVALQRPARPLFIGRKSCLPAAPIFAGFVESATHLDALLAVPLASARRLKDEPIIAELPAGAEPPPGFRRVYRADRRDWAAGAHMGGSFRWSGSLPRQAFRDEPVA